MAGTVAAGVWAAQQPLDKRVFESDYDDVELLGKLVTRGDSWPAAGLALHASNGALFGAVYSQLRPFVPGPPVLAGLAAGLAEHFALWPLVSVIDRVHPQAFTSAEIDRASVVAQQFGPVLARLASMQTPR